MTEYYVSGCIDNGSEIETCDDSEATFWTLYERDAEGLSQGIIDCKFREDTEAAMRVYQERDALQQQVNALEVLADERRVFIINGAEMGYIQLPVFDEDPATRTYERCLLEPGFAIDAIKRQWMAEGCAEHANDLRLRSIAARERGYDLTAACLSSEADRAERFTEKLRQPEEKGHE